MIKKRISISYAADEAEAFYIETVIRSTAAKVIEENGAKQMKIEMETLPTENSNFEFDERKIMFKRWRLKEA